MQPDGAEHAERSRTGAAILWRTVTRNARLLTSGSLLICAHQLCEAMVPVLIGVLVDRAVKPGDAGQLLVWIGVLAALFVALTACYRLGARHLMRAIATEGHQLRIDLAARILEPRRLRTSQRTGELLSIASTDADNVSYLLDYIPRIAGAITAIAVCATVLLTIDVPLGVAVLIGTPLILFVLHFGGPVITRRVADQQEAAGEATAMSADLIAGLRPLRGIGAERAASARYRKVSRDALTAGIRAARTQGVYLGFSTSLSALLAVGVAVLAGWYALRGEITIGQLITVIGLAQFLLEPFGTMAEVPSWVAEARASAERVGWIEDAPFALSPGAAAIGSGPHGVQLDAIRYGSLDGLTLSVDPGELIGVVTTRSSDAEALVGVLAGRLAATEYSGEILLGGVPLADLSLTDARTALLVEPHRADLFTGSLRSNLSDADIEPGVLTAALQASNAADVIDVHRDGLDHKVTERGSSLSGGQRQRLTLARALLRAAPVLVLHEPTTAVDTVTESSVAQGIADLRHRGSAACTTVIVTSSPALLAVADRVVLVDEGRATGAGTHEELLDRPDYRAAVLR
ncbi:ABC transporter ATP-binding protein [Mycobacterium sp. C31M]